MAMLRGTFSSDLLVEGLREVFFLQYDEKSLIYPQIFEIKTSKHERETDRSVAGLTMPVAKSEGASITYEDFVDGYEAEYIHSTYAKGIRMSEELIEDQLYGVMEKRSKALARVMRYRQEYDHASLFNSANATTVFTGGDGVALLTASHPRADGGGNQSNIATTDLTQSALKTAITNFRNLTDDRGLLIGYTPKTLLIPNELEFDAIELLNSSGRPYTADNEINAVKGRLNVVIWDFLTDADSWFILSNKSADAPLSFTRTAVSFKEDGDFDTGDLKMKARMRYSFGFSDWRWAYGSMGA